MVVNCSVQDCKHQIRFNCQKPVIEIDKGGRCVSFSHKKGSQNRDLSKVYPEFKRKDPTSKK
jgi:hypothetical protein